MYKVTIKKLDYWYIEQIFDNLDNAEIFIYESLIEFDNVTYSLQKLEGLC